MIQEPEAAAEPGAGQGVRVQPIHLVRLRRYQQRPRLLQLRVDPLVAHECHELRQVPPALGLQDVELVTEMEEAVGETVGQARLAEPAVATARAPADALGLEHGNAQPRVRLEQADRRPEPREASAHDGHVHALAAPDGDPR